MKKILLALVVLVFAAPAMATVNITISHVQDTNEVTIGFDATGETNFVRAFGLNIQLDNDANIVSVEGLSTDYWVYPGTIVIAADGEITDIGSIAAEYDDLPSDTLPGPPDGNGVTLECASLYAPVGHPSPNEPLKSGELAKLIIDKDCTLCVTANVSRAGATGVVMENPDEVVTVGYLPSQCIEVNVPEVEDECYKGMADYAQWEAAGKPTCWCYQRQCRGDADGLKQGSALAGYMYVGTDDLNILIDGWKILDPPKGPGLSGNQACADFDHARQGSALAGYMRVGTNDLNVLIAHWKVLEPPKGAGVPGDCQPGNESPD
jgi:hypothetical protein